MDYQTRAQSTPAIDEGLRQYMMSVYNYMASGLALTGLVAYMLFQATAVMGPSGDIVGLTSLGVTLYTGPMMWVVALAPLGIVMYMSFGIRNMSASRAQTMFWIFAFLMGLSLSTIFLTYTGASIARVFFITASTFGAMSIYGYTTKRDLTEKLGSSLSSFSFVLDKYLSLSQASDAFDTSSRIKTSFSEYTELIINFSN